MDIETTDWTQCRACTETVPADCIVSAEEANTGGDAICYRCHVDCMPEDAETLADGLDRCREFFGLSEVR